MTAKLNMLNALIRNANVQRGKHSMFMNMLQLHFCLELKYGPMDRIGGSHEINLMKENKSFDRRSIEMNCWHHPSQATSTTLW